MSSLPAQPSSSRRRAHAAVRAATTQTTPVFDRVAERVAALSTARRNPSGSSQRIPIRFPSRAPGFGLVAGGPAGSSGGILLFGLLSFLLVLAIPNAVRWLRPAVARGLSPRYVALRDRPG